MHQAHRQNKTSQKAYTKYQAVYLAHALTIDGSARDSVSKSLLENFDADGIRISPHSAS